MVSVKFIAPDGAERVAEGREGETVLDVALGSLVPGIIGECGGNLSCATCHVYVDEVWVDRLPLKTADEEDMLEGTTEEPAPNSRLCCQIRITPQLDGLRLRVPASQR